MQKQRLFNQIIECLEIESENHAYADVSPAVLHKFMQLKNVESAKFAKPVVGKVPEPVRSVPVANFAKTKEAVNPVLPGNALKPSGKLDLDKMQMDELAVKVAECTLCGLHETRNKPIFGDETHRAELMFIGEAPGRDEDKQSDQLLARMIIAMQFTLEEVYIANVVKCRPPGNRNIRDEEAEKCLPYLNRQIDIIRPKVIVMLGPVPLKYLLGLPSITKTRGVWHEYRGIKVMPTLHPAYVLRNPKGARKEVWDDLQEVMKFFGRKSAPVKKT